MKTLNLKSFYALTSSITEDSCREYLAELRWNGKPVCPHCGYSEKIYVYTKRKLYRCAKCDKQFSVTVGTIFHASHIPLKKWFLAIYLFSSHKKGISSHQIARDLEITQPNTWYMLHRIRFAMGNSDMFKGQLEGEIEADETYVGGKNKNRHWDKKIKGSQGRSTIDKAAVFGLMQRSGKIFLWVVKNLKKSGMQAMIKAKVKQGSKLATDEYANYTGLSRFYQHGIVNHGRGQYSTEDCHTNTLEGFWSWIKRGIIGIYHGVSKFYLIRYCKEFAYRYNTRKISEEMRFTTLLSECFDIRYRAKGLYLSE